MSLICVFPTTTKQIHLDSTKLREQAQVHLATQQDKMECKRTYSMIGVFKRKAMKPVEYTTSVDRQLDKKRHINEAGSWSRKHHYKYVEHVV
jgi:hypothetical protein